MLQLSFSSRVNIFATNRVRPPLLRVAEKESINKMSLHNLATVFGPTLLRPSEKDSKIPANPTQPISMGDSWSLEVMAQVSFCFSSIVMLSLSTLHQLEPLKTTLTQLGLIRFLPLTSVCVPAGPGVAVLPAAGDDPHPGQ